MQINREKSRKITKLLSLTLATEMMLSLGIDAKASEFDSVEQQKKHHEVQHELEMKVANLSPELYDKEYNDYCNNGTIEINGIEYLIKYLHIEYGYIGDKKIVYLKDYHNPKLDIITGNIIDERYERVKIIDLKYSDVFYEYYHSNKEKPLSHYVNLFEGNINYNVPETYFYNPIFTKEDKVKSK